MRSEKSNLNYSRPDLQFGNGMGQSGVKHANKHSTRQPYASDTASALVRACADAQACMQGRAPIALEPLQLSRLPCTFIDDHCNTDLNVHQDCHTELYQMTPHTQFCLLCTGTQRP